MGRRSPMGLQRGWVITVSAIEQFAIVLCGGSAAWWVGLRPKTREVYLSRARAFLRYLGSVKDGEVVALGEGAVGKVIEELAWMARLYDDSKSTGQCAQDAYEMSCTARKLLRALKGEAE